METLNDPAAARSRDIEPGCDISGRCVAWEEDRPRGVSNCQECGKQLEYIGGRWWTWDVADAVRRGDTRSALPQDEDKGR